MEGVSRWSENGKAKALRHQVGVMLLANWAEEEVEEESSVFCGPGTLPRPSFPHSASLGSFPAPVWGRLQTPESSRESSLVACIFGCAVI